MPKVEMPKSLSNAEVALRLRALAAELEGTVDARSPRSPQGGGRALQPQLATDGVLPDTDDFDRPSLYPHPPKPHQDLLESIQTKGDLISTLRQSEFEGVFNLSLILLTFSLTYNVVRSVMEHGNRVTFSPLLCPSFREDVLTGVKFHLALVLYSCVFYFLVRQTVRNKRLSSTTLIVLYSIAQLLLLVLPPVFIIHKRLSPLVGLWLCVLNLIFVLKGHSYVATNHHLSRQATAHKEATRKARLKALKDGDCDTPDSGTSEDGHPLPIRGKHMFPSNVTFGDFLYFMVCVPVLAYEPQYPYNKTVRVDYVIKKLAQAAIIAFLIYCIFMQFMLPVLQQNNAPFVYAVMKLAIPSFIMWLGGFYAAQGCLLNAVSEAVGFADRRFYLDWWNTTSIESFWRRWNLPVHEWALRHVFVDMIHYAKVNKVAALISTFFVSAVFHEFIFFVALHGTTSFPWFFFGMLLQIPLVYTSDKWVGRRRGNLLMWWSLFSGQPLLELLYFREWFMSNNDVFCVR